MLIDIPERPVWFFEDDAQPVRDILRWFLQQLKKQPFDQRSRLLNRKLTPKNCPQLFDYANPEKIAFLESLVGLLAKPPFKIWQIKKYTGFLVHSGSDDFYNLTLSFDAESLLRLWLNDPLLDPLTHQWRLVVDETSWLNSRQQLLLKQLGYPGVFTPQQIMESLYNIQELLDKPEQDKYTLRQLSGEFFWGVSKYLERNSRYQWLNGIFPALETIINVRPILLNVHLSSFAESILIVENQDTFFWLSETNDPRVEKFHIVYGKGFNVAAQRVRQPDGVNFLYSGNFSLARTFESLWLDATNVVNFYFWGDLDYSGMSILKALKQSFLNIVAWQLGYAPMIDILTNGGGHLPEHSSKTGQHFSGVTGCEFADKKLIPAIKLHQRFLDQESIRRLEVD